MTFEKEQFARAIELWTEWNGKINVVSRKDIDNLFEHHILHSLAVCQYLSVNGHIGGEASQQTAALDDRNKGIMAVCGPGQQAGNFDDQDRGAMAVCGPILQTAALDDRNKGIMAVCGPGQQAGSFDDRDREIMAVCGPGQQTAALDDRNKGIMAVCGPGQQAGNFDDQNRGAMAVCGPGQRAGSQRESFLDVGCGGGFPGVPLAMVMPEAEFTLCDSIGKKVRVAQAVAEGLGLKNVKCVNARAEDVSGQFDWIVSRAVTSLDNFYPWVKGKFRKGILYLKGGDVNGEISAMCSKCHVNPSSVTVWPVREWLDDDYFSEKFVIHIRK